MARKIKILIADSNKLVQEGYASLLSKHPQYVISGQVNSGAQLLDALKKQRPDIVLIDLQLPETEGGVVFDKILRVYDTLKTIIVSSFYSDYLVAQFFLKGIRAYLPRCGEPKEILQSLDAVMKEGYYFKKPLNKKEALYFYEQIRLTETELQVLKLIYLEKGNKQIAKELGLSSHTVDYYRRNLFAKTNQTTVVGLVKYAMQQGIEFL